MQTYSTVYMQNANSQCRDAKSIQYENMSVRKCAGVQTSKRLFPSLAHMRAVRLLCTQCIPPRPLTEMLFALNANSDMHRRAGRHRFPSAGACVCDTRSYRFACFCKRSCRVVGASLCWRLISRSSAVLRKPWCSDVGGVSTSRGLLVRCP